LARGIPASGGEILPVAAVCAILIAVMFSPRRAEPAGQFYQLPAGSTALPIVRAKDCVVALKALAEDTRVNIVGLLIPCPLSVGEIATALGASHYNVSKHLRILREAGLVEVQKRGRERRYGLPAAFKRRAESGEVIDLGCCTFQFNRTGEKADPPPTRAPRSRSTRRPQEG
jgi:DNA-binding transcriptional ArsR family regulator